MRLFLTDWIMKKFISTIPPFLLLILPFFAAMLLLAGAAESERLEQRIRLDASFISLPEVNVFHVLLR